MRFDARLSAHLLVFALGSTPIETGLMFDSLDDCLKAEQNMRAEYLRDYNAWVAWAQANKAESDYPEAQERDA